MTWSVERPSAIVATLISLVFLASCGSEGGGTGPSSTPRATSIVATGGQGQSGPVASVLGTPLQVRVSDQFGDPMPGFNVVWSVTSGGGSVSAGTSTTDSGGNAQVTWTLGTTAGTQTVTATGTGLATVTFTVTALAGPAADISVTPSAATIAAFGATQQLTGQMVDAHGNPTVGGPIIWSSNMEGVATVDGAGLVTAVSNGQATILASLVPFEATATITVQQEAGSVEVEAQDDEVEVGKFLQLAATVKDANGNEFVGAPVQWSSSDDGRATVDAAGLVAGVAEGPVTITGSSGSASGGVNLVVIQPRLPFNPPGNQNVSGVIEASDVTVGAGVTLTVIDDLVINASGSVVIHGTLAGDCHAVTINGQGAITLTGTIDNHCAVDPGGSEQDLRIFGDGPLDLDGVTIISSGDVDIQNDPFLTDADFDDVTFRLPAFSAAGLSAQVDPCDVKGATFRPDPLSAPPDPQTGKSADGRTWALRCMGTLNLGGDPTNGNQPTTISGQNGAHADFVVGQTSVSGDDGTKGGKLKILATGDIIFGGNGGTVLELGDGGNGGGATANGIATGGSATATGGKGAEPGGLEVKARGAISIGPGTLTIEAGNGGDGGPATANGANGKNSNGGPAENGGDATATGGKGGNSLKAEFKAVGAVSGGGHVAFSGGDGGKGGNATANGGKGGDGVVEHEPDGADGGTMTVSGGDGGDAQTAGLGGLPLGTGGMGGDISLLGGLGGDGWDDCVFPDYKPGGLAGRGGSIAGRNGAGGAGGMQPGQDGAYAVALGTGDGGIGGDGFGPGDGGDGGTDGVNSTSPAFPDFPKLRDGLPGQPCEKKSWAVTLVAQSPQPEDQIQLVPRVTGFMTWIDWSDVFQVNGQIILDDGAGPLPFFEGGANSIQNGSFNMFAFGPVTAGVNECQVAWAIQGTMDPITWDITGQLLVGPVPPPCGMANVAVYDMTATPIPNPGPPMP